MKSTARLTACLSALALLACQPRLAGQTASVTILHTFPFLNRSSDNSDGANPNAALILGSDGNFYGTAEAGGSNGVGTVFQVTPAGVFTTLHSFNGGDGLTPEDALVQGSDGLLYGTTSDSLGDAFGTVFSITHAGALTTLHGFTSADAKGLIPAGALVQGSDGNFYGMTNDGPGADFGTVFSMTPAGVVTTLYIFTGTGTDGKYPGYPLIQAADGNFYGVTIQGGSNNKGTVFQVTPAGVLTTLHSFNGTDGSDPGGGLVQGNDGNFYGTTLRGGGGTGTLFAITPAGAFTTLHSFSAVDANSANADGGGPNGELVQDSEGTFYGATYEGGTSGDGTLFKMTPAGVLTTLHSFENDGTDGTHPYAGLTQGGVGVFYGTAYDGGADENGTIFKLVLAPVVTSATTAKANVGSKFTYRITATNNPTSYGASGLPAGLTVDTGTGGISGTPTVKRTYVSTISAVNAGGTGSATLTITVAGPVPVINSATSTTATQGSAFSYQITATNNPTSFDALNLPAGLSVNTTTGVISGTPTGSGSASVGLKATNSEGSGGAPLSLTIKGTAPVVTSATTAAATQGGAFSYQITATNSPTKYGESGIPTGLSIDQTTGKISGMPTVAGTFTVTIAAFNATGAGTAKLALTVKAAAPLITSALTATASQGSTFTYQITATNSPTKYGESGIPAGLTIDQTSGKISGTPTAPGTYTVTIAAFNATGAGTAKLTLTVKAAAPAITSSLSATATVGTAFSYQITATNSPTIYGESGIPAGLSINQTTGKISGTPTKAGTYSVTIAAFNATGSGSAKLTLTVH